jgi:soluble lytic murein transglycosylase
MKVRTIISLAIAVALNAFVASVARGDVYAFKDKNGVVTFTNVPNHAGFRRVFRDTNHPAPSSGVIDSSYEEYIQTASGRYNLDPDLIRAVIKAESDFNVSARSNKGAMGLMQLMPDTARLHNVNAYNPSENVEGGARHLRMLLDRYQGDLELSLAAYNAGSAAVEKHRGIPPFPETKEYVRRVLRFYESYRNVLQPFQPVAR